LQRYHDDRESGRGFEGRCIPICTHDAQVPLSGQAEAQLVPDKIMDNPLKDLEIEILNAHVERLFKKHFKGKDSATEEELQIGARLARSECIYLFSCLLERKLTEH
jgi:hypothetical protein